VIEVMALRKGKDALPLALAAARSDKPEMKLAGIRLLGRLGDASTIMILTDSLAKGGKVAEAAQQALCRPPREAVGKAMLTAMAERPEIRGPVFRVLSRLKYYEAIDPLIAIAKEDDPTAYEPALAALREIADPDDTDLPRLVKLLLAVQGKHREEVERAILIVCQKSRDAAADRAKPVLAVLAKVGSSELPKCLPLLGRLGGPQVLGMIDSSVGVAPGVDGAQSGDGSVDRRVPGQPEPRPDGLPSDCRPCPPPLPASPEHGPLRTTPGEGKPNQQGSQCRGSSQQVPPRSVTRRLAGWPILDRPDGWTGPPSFDPFRRPVETNVGRTPAS
jgi:hypothetical protein